MSWNSSLTATLIASMVASSAAAYEPKIDPQASLAMQIVQTTSDYYPFKDVEAYELNASQEGKFGALGYVGGALFGLLVTDVVAGIAFVSASNAQNNFDKDQMILFVDADNVRGLNQEQAVDKVISNIAPDVLDSVIQFSKTKDGMDNIDFERLTKKTLVDSVCFEKKAIGEIPADLPYHKRDFRVCYYPKSASVSEPFPKSQLPSYVQNIPQLQFADEVVAIRAHRLFSVAAFNEAYQEGGHALPANLFSIFPANEYSKQPPAIIHGNKAYLFMKNTAIESQSVPVDEYFETFGLYGNYYVQSGN
ncbi:hypothetical protein [Enterovibrio norvegicus]|uniref:hypothetical protein n=1 Tax=Enterovibrio norvegicus TaxID=188144 RepID=UPI00352C6C07